MAVCVTRVRHGDVNRKTRPRTTRFLAVRREYSDDLFMFFKGQIDGLVPGARYAAAVSVEIATDTPAGCFGIGGAPGESVWIKVGATAIEPLPVLEGTYLRMNIDIGNQANGGDHAVVLGDIANSRRCEQSPQWERKSFPGQSVFAYTAHLAPATHTHNHDLQHQTTSTRTNWISRYSPIRKKRPFIRPIRSR